MALTKEEVEHIAQLARLGISEEEKVLFATQLSSVLEYVNKLQEVNTEGIAYEYHIKGLETVVRKDEVVPSQDIERDILLADMPEQTGDLLKVKGVFEA